MNTTFHSSLIFQGRLFDFFFIFFAYALTRSIKFGIFQSVKKPSEVRGVKSDSFLIGKGVAEGIIILCFWTYFYPG